MGELKAGDVIVYEKEHCYPTYFKDILENYGLSFGLVTKVLDNGVETEMYAVKQDYKFHGVTFFNDEIIKIGVL